MILNKIVQQRKLQLQQEENYLPLSTVQRLSEQNTAKPLDLAKFLQSKPFGIIAELKKASPSKGILVQNFQPQQQALRYQELGAQAISCLTEEYYFQGSSKYLKQIRPLIQIPILRKDFIIDAYQIYESLVMGADAILLIAAILDTTTLSSFIKLATQLGLSCLVEVHDAEELEKALAVGAQLIGVNNRNLKTFQVDISTSLELAGKIPPNITLVSESGISTRQQIMDLQQAGYRAALIGETLMCSRDLAATFAELLGTENAG